MNNFHQCPIDQHAPDMSKPGCSGRKYLRGPRTEKSGAKLKPSSNVVIPDSRQPFPIRKSLPKAKHPYNHGYSARLESLVAGV